MARNPVVLIHGYSDKGASFKNWSQILRNAGFQTHICTYQSLTNEVTVKDLAEGLDRALKTCAGLEEGEDFDAIVHSTGMLVLRSWLTTYPKRRDRLKRLIGIAPATFGSPVARMGRSWLGAIVKGNRQEGPDFLEAGDKILDALEIASPFTWDLAHKDMFCDPEFYGPDRSTPYVFVFCGTDMYSGFRRFVSSPGTDGTVRIAGCGLNARKFRIDLSRAPERSGRGDERITISRNKTIDLPVWPIKGLTHGTIISDPTPELQDLVLKALRVERLSQQSPGDDSYNSWFQTAKKVTDPARESIGQWQQFIVHAVDERGDPINDYQIELYSKATGDTLDLQLDPDIYKYDTSYRAYHVDVRDLVDMHGQVYVKIMAKSGSALVDYHGTGGERMNRDDGEGVWDAIVEITVSTEDGQNFFQPLTTTLIELVLNRDPLPFNSNRVKLCYFEEM
jgi:pimeloyl-ACP methyl ester carboxylesterase